MTVVSSLVIEMAANVARLQTDMDRARKTVESATGRMTSAANTAMNALKGLGLGLGAVSFGNFISSTAQANKELSQFAMLAGMAVKDFQQVALASTRFGVSQEKLADILKDTQDKVGDFMQTGGGAMADFFERVAPKVGVTADQFRKLNGKDALQLYVSSLEKANLSQSDMVFFMEAIASDSTLLLPLFQENGKALGELAAQADAFGLAMDDGAIRASKELSDRLSDLGDFTKGIGQTIYRELLPGLIAATTAMVDWAKASGVAQIAGNIIKAVFQAISVVGSDVVFVITQISRGMVALAQASGKVLTGDFSGAANVFTEYNAQAIVARKSLDDMQAKIMGIGQASTATAEVVNKSSTTLSAAFTKPTEAAKAAAKELAEQRKKDLAFGEYMNKQVEERAKREAELVKDMIKLHEDSLKPFEQSLKALQGRIEAIKDEEQALAMSEALNISLAEAVQRVSLEKLKQLQIDSLGNPDAVANIQRQIELQKEYIDLVAGKQAREASTQAAKQANEDWKRTADTIERSLTDALLRGFESGKGFAQNLRDTLKNMFNTLVLRPIIQAVVGGVTGLGGAAANASGVGGNPLGALQNLYSMGSATAAVGSQWMAGTMSSANAAGTLGANMTGTGIDGLLASNGAYGTAGSSATTLGAAGTMLGGVLVGFMAGKMISGGYSAVGKSGNTAVVVGTAIGALVGGPIGAAIGGAIGGAVNRAFGRKAKEVTGEGITGTFGPSGASVQGYSDWMQKGGTFRSDKSGREMSALPYELSSLLSDSVGALRTGVSGYAAAIGLSTDAVDTFSKSINISLKGLDAAGREKAINDAMASFGDDLANAALGAAGAAFVRAGETSSQALTRLSGSLQAVNAVLGTLNQNALAVSLAGGDAASKLADLFGGLPGLTQATSAYFQAFYSESERNSKITQQLTTALAAMGAKLPDTLSGFRALVDAQDLTTEAGRRNYAALINLAPAFAQVTGAADSLAAKLGKVVSQLATEALTQIDNQITASTAAADAARAAATAYRDASTSLTAAVASIMGAVGDARQNAEQAYGTALASARGGDVSAMQALPQLATAMLAQQRNGAGSSLQAALQSAKAATELSGVGSVANALTVQKDYQAKLYDVNTATLEVLRSQLASGNATVDQLKALGTTLTNVGQMLIDSDKLTVGAVTNSSGVIKATLVDTSGRVVGTLDNNTALNLNGLNGQTSILSKLSADQILKLQAGNSVQADSLAVQEIATRATGGSAATLTDVLAQLKLPDPSLNLITAQIANGNFAIVNSLSGVVGAINNQTAAQQNEIKRQQDLAKAQKDIEALVSTYLPQIDNLSSSLSAKKAEKASYDHSIAAVAPHYNGWSYGVRWNFDNVWKPASARLAGEISQAESALGNMTNTYNGQLEAMRQQIRNLGGVPAFALGGMHSGGMRLVGENGPELEVTGPARIFNAQQTQDMLRASTAPVSVQNRGGQQGDPALRQLVADLTTEVVNLRAEARAGAVAGQQLQQQFKRLTRDGQSMPVTSVQNDPITVKVAA